MPVVHCVELSSEFFFFTCKEQYNGTIIAVHRTMYSSQVEELVEPQANLEVVWHSVELVHMVHLFLVSHINHLTPLLRKLSLHIPQPSDYANTYSCQFLNLLDETTCIYKCSTIHVGVLDGDGGLLSEGVLEDEVLLLSLASGRCPAAHSTTTGGGPVSGCGGGAGGDTQLPLTELLHVLDLLEGDAAMGGREAGISEKA